MERVYQVEWKKTCKSLFTKFSLFGALLLVICIGLNYQNLKSDSASIAILAWILVAFPICTALGSLLLSLLFIPYHITLTDTDVQGRTFWGLKNKIPLTDISGFYDHHHQGIESIVVKSAHHGEIWIHSNTEKLGELLGIVSNSLPNSAIPLAVLVQLPEDIMEDRLKHEEDWYPKRLN
jgi:hypothetical protein